MAMLRIDPADVKAPRAVDPVASACASAPTASEVLPATDRNPIAVALSRLPLLLLALIASPLLAQTAQPIPRATFIATMDAQFKLLDANHDGIVTRAELEASEQRAATALAVQRAAALFAEADSDHNGQLSLTEFTRLATATPPRVDVSATMNRLDLNRDQKITLIENRTATLANFDKLDTDKDGVVSAAEMKAGGITR